MKILHGYKGIKEELRDPITAIGVFDGVHLGHKRVINKVLSVPDKDRDRVVVTFDPHPRAVLCPDRKPPRIMSIEHRLEIFRRMGLDAVVVINFTDAVAGMSPEEFVKRVLSGIGTRKVYVGSNFHFGAGRSGSIAVLKRIGEKYGIEINDVSPVKKGNRVISSTWVRKLISSGRITEAEKLLRRSVSILGTVVGGDKRGKRLGIPTANIDPHHEVFPPPGAYAVVVLLGKRYIQGVLNVGFNPTFYGSRLKKRMEPKIEVNLLDFEGDIYGHTIEMFFVKRLRKERRFRTERALKAQIQKDIAAARAAVTDKSFSVKEIRDKGTR